MDGFRLSAKKSSLISLYVALAVSVTAIVPLPARALVGGAAIQNDGLANLGIVASGGGLFYTLLAWIGSVPTGLAPGFVVAGLILDAKNPGKLQGLELSPESVSEIGITEDHRLVWNRNLEALNTAFSNLDFNTKSSSQATQMQAATAFAAIAPDDQKLINQTIAALVAHANRSLKLQ